MRAQTANSGLHENSTDSTDHEVEPADSTAALTEAARRAELLAGELRELANGKGFAASALYDIDRLQEIAPALREMHHQYLANSIAASTGNAVGHRWIAGDVEIRCTTCDCSALPRELRLGRVPACGDICPNHPAGGHWVRHSYREDRAACMHCDTVYPSTAPEGGTR